MKITHKMVNDACDAVSWGIDGPAMTRALTAALATQPDREAEHARLTAEVARLKDNDALVRHLSAENIRLRGMIDKTYAPKMARLTAVVLEFVRDFGENEDADSKRMLEEARAALEATDDK